MLDFDFPEDLHDGLDFAPPCRMRVRREDLGPYNKRLAPERLPKMGMHEREAVDSERLRFMRNELGARVWRLHEAITFMRSPILQPGKWRLACARICLGSSPGRHQICRIKLSVSVPSALLKGKQGLKAL